MMRSGLLAGVLMALLGYAGWALGAAAPTGSAGERAQVWSAPAAPVERLDADAAIGQMAKDRFWGLGSDEPEATDADALSRSERVTAIVSRGGEIYAAARDGRRDPEDASVRFQEGDTLSDGSVVVKVEPSWITLALNGEERRVHIYDVPDE